MERNHNSELQAIKSFKQYLNERASAALAEAADEKQREAFYSEVITIAFGSEKITVSNGPEIFNAIYSALEEYIENI